MSENQKIIEKNIPGMNRHERFQLTEHAENFHETMKRIIAYFIKEKKRVFIMFVVVFLGTLCGIYAPSLQSEAIDMIAGTRDGYLIITVCFMLFIYLLYSVSQLLQGILSAQLSQSIVCQMREELFHKIIDLPLQYIDTHANGDIMSRMTNDIENISTTISQSLPSFFSGILTIIGTVIIMICYCWQLALLSCLTVILTLLTTKFISQKVRHFSRKRQSLLGKLNSTVEEMIVGYHTVVAYNHQDEVIDSFCETADALTKEGIKTDVYSGVMGPIMNCIGNIGFVIIAVFGGYFSLHGYISIGVISAFIVYAKQFSRPINEIAQIYGQLQTAIACAERVFTILDEENEDKEGCEMMDSQDMTIVFQNVSFSYDKKHPVIQNFNLTIPSGNKVAFVGATGSGKTTLVNLLIRFYDVDSGHILINGQDISQISRDSLRKKMAIVLQETALFSNTIEYNLTYGQKDLLQEDIQKAIQLSHCQDFIQQLPFGLQTQLVRAGDNLSQGQRQLLTIARTFIANPQILILDEATSNVDTRTEMKIQDAMYQIMQNRTSVIIAHRLSTIRNADFIVVLNQGQIVESGSHDELLSKKGKYYELYQTQYAGFQI